MEKVIVCVEQCYSDNNGAFDVVYEWNGECVETRTLRDGDYEVVSVNASAEQKVAAGDWMQINSKDVNVRNGVATYIGCEVILKRSRKAPNGKPLVVLSHQDRAWNNNYGRYDDEKVCVEVDGTSVWVSVGCVDSVAKYIRPWWAK